MQMRLVRRQLSDREPAYRLGGAELSRVLGHHERDVFIPSHAPACGEPRHAIGPTRPELKAMWQPGGGNLIQQFGYVLWVSLEALDPDSVERRKSHPRDRGEPSALGASPATLDYGLEELERFDERCCSHCGIDGHAPILCRDKSDERGSDYAISSRSGVQSTPDPGMTSSLRQLREATVLEHMEAENAHDFARCIAAFSHPRYEIVATGEVWDGHAGVNTLLNENKKGFPNFHFQPETMHHADSAVIVEGRFTGTHDGNWRGLPATGRKVDFPLIIVFQFDEERMVCERTYFDIGTPLRQLGVARDPNSRAGKVATVVNHPLVVGKALIGSLFHR